MANKLVTTDRLSRFLTRLYDVFVPNTLKINNKTLSGDITLSASDVSAVPTTRQVNNKALSADITLAASDVGAVPTTRKVNDKVLSSDITLSASDVGAIASTDKGVANGVCPLNSSSKIDSTYLPSYVDDVIEVYPRTGQTELSSTWLAEGSASGSAITPETGKLYILMADSTNYATNTQFRWSGTTYVEIISGGYTLATDSDINALFA